MAKGSIRRFNDPDSRIRSGQWKPLSRPESERLKRQLQGSTAGQTSGVIQLGQQLPRVTTTSARHRQQAALLKQMAVPSVAPDHPIYKQGQTSFLVPGSQAEPNPTLPQAPPSQSADQPPPDAPQKGQP
jgi:hypothetical protein